MSTTLKRPERRYDPWIQTMGGEEVKNFEVEHGKVKNPPMEEENLMLPAVMASSVEVMMRPLPIAAAWMDQLIEYAGDGGMEEVRQCRLN